MEREICAKSPATWNSYIIKPSTGGPGVPCRHRGSCQIIHFSTGFPGKKLSSIWGYPHGILETPRFLAFPNLETLLFPLLGKGQYLPIYSYSRVRVKLAITNWFPQCQERAILNPPYTLMVYTPIYRKIGDGGSYGFANIMFDGKFDAKTSAIQGFSAKQQHHDCNADVGSSSPWTNRLWTCEKPPVLNEGASKGGSPKVYGGFLK